MRGSGLTPAVGQKHAKPTLEEAKQFQAGMDIGRARGTIFLDDMMESTPAVFVVMFHPWPLPEKELAIIARWLTHLDAAVLTRGFKVLDDRRAFMRGHNPGFLPGIVRWGDKGRSLGSWRR